MLIATPAHGAEEELSDHDQKTNTALNVVRHQPPAWLEKSRNKLILLLQETCKFPTDLGNIIVDMMGDCGYGKWFLHITIKNKLEYRIDKMHIVTLSDGRFAVTSPKTNIIKVYDSDGNLQDVLQHDSKIYFLSACSDGTGILASCENKVYAWTLAAGKKAQLRAEFSEKLSTSGMFNHLLELSPHRLVIGHAGELQLWNTQNEECIATSRCDKTIKTLLTRISTGDIAFGYKDTHLEDDRNWAVAYGIALWNIRTGALSYIPQAHDNIMSAITALPHGLFATAAHSLPEAKAPIKVWNSKNNTLLHTLYPQKSRMAHSLVALPDGILASGAYKTIDIWNYITGVCIRTLHNETMDLVEVLLKLPHGHLAAGGTGKNITIWDVAKGLCLQTLSCSDDIVTLKVLSDVKLLSRTTNGGITLWGSAIQPETFTLQASQTPSNPRTPQVLSARNTAQSHCRIS